jgi:hypothetical protein
MTTKHVERQLPIHVEVLHNLDRRDAAREVELLSEILSDPEEMGLTVEVNVGDMRVRLLVDGQGTIDITAVHWQREDDDFGTLHPPGGTQLRWNCRARPVQE